MPGQGKRGEVKQVADGYASNYLLPRKLALPATATALKEVEAKRQREAHQQELAAAALERIAQQLEGAAFTFKERVMSKDRLWGSVRQVHIAQAASRLTGFDIDKERVQLEEPIRHLGSYEVKIRLAQELTPTVKIQVEEGKER